MKDKLKKLVNKAADKLESFMLWLESKMLGNMTAEETEKKTHYIKCEAEYFSDVIDGYKSFELRKNDRDYRPGDDIVLREYNGILDKLTGRECRVEIIYMLEDYPGIEPGYCILGIEEY